MTKHTPLFPIEYAYIETGNNAQIVTTDNRELIAEFDHTDDARDFCMVANCHDELLEALKEAKIAMQEHMNCCGESDILLAPMEMIDQAIAKATGKEASNG